MKILLFVLSSLLSVFADDYFAGGIVARSISDSSIRTTGGLGARYVKTDSLKIGAGSIIKDITVIDGAADTLSITVGAKTWKFLPVANQ